MAAGGPLSGDPVNLRFDDICDPSIGFGLWLQPSPCKVERRFLRRSATLQRSSSPPPTPRKPSEGHGRKPFEGHGLSTVLETGDFSCWDAALASTLGHHRSDLLAPERPFQARFQTGQLGGYGVVHIQSRGRLRLIREQCDNSVLWLPLRGMTQERINGQTWLAEPGTGLLFHPGDAMEGETSEEIEGISILIPGGLERPRAHACPPLLGFGRLQQRILSSARTLAAALAGQPLGAEQAAEELTEALRVWTEWLSQPHQRERFTSRRRRDTVEQARQWMEPRLQERFTVVELSQAVGVSPRQLQYNFLLELGNTPMAEAKRLRLHRLRALLSDPAQDQRSVAELMAAAGLIASGATSADYRRWCGELPKQTRRWRPVHPPLPGTMD